MDLTGPFDPTTVHDPNRWQPLRFIGTGGNIVTQTFLAPFWNRVVPFALTSNDQFRSPTGPATFDTQLYAHQAEAVLEWMQNTKDYLRSSNGGPASVAPRTTLVYAPDHVSQARALAAAMGLPASALHGDGPTSDTIGRMVLTLGQDFHGIGKPFAVPAPAVPSASAGAGTTGGASGCGSQ